jgi:hypothetical protein
MAFSIRCAGCGHTAVVLADDVEPLQGWEVRRVGDRPRPAPIVDRTCPTCVTRPPRRRAEDARAIGEEA